MYENLNNYKVFYTVAQTGSISKAAEALYISQPAISKSISKLEEGLEVTLFIRSSKGVQLTEEGMLLFSHLEKAFHNISKAEDEIKRIGSLGIGQLRIGASTSLCKYILLDYLKQFIVAYPHIKVTIDCHSTINTIHLLKEDKIDIGLICETDIPNGFIYDKITDIHDIFICNNAYLDNLNYLEQEEKEPEENPWLFAGNLTSIIEKEKKNEKKVLSYKEILEKSNLMLLDRNNITRMHVEQYLAAERIIPNQILEINNMDLLVDFASIGMGVSCVVREFAKEQIESGQVVELSLPKPIQKRTVGFLYANTKTMPTALRNFIDFCKNN
ncbi:MAG: LysR family transcriptional regulator [Lachnospiraceae bacterium]|nr:LysR family transcriptional regulator [Lachnospiraceae bacterium]